MLRALKRLTPSGHPYLEFPGLEAAMRDARARAKRRIQYVHDTWLNRSEEHKIRNLATGLVAQKVLEAVFRLARIPFISYEATRIDRFENDDPFDFILLPPAREDFDALVAWLRREIYPKVNIQGRLRQIDRARLLARLKNEDALLCDLKSSVDNRNYGIAQIIGTQNYIAYATQKNSAGGQDIPGREYLRQRGFTYDEYVLEHKQSIKDVHCQVFFSDPECATAFYPGFVFGRDLVLKGTVGPLPPVLWVLYHKLPIRDGYKPGQEVAALFSGISD